MVDKDVVMTLLAPAEVLCNVKSYDFYVITLRHWLTSSSYD